MKSNLCVDLTLQYFFLRFGENVKFWCKKKGQFIRWNTKKKQQRVVVREMKQQQAKMLPKEVLSIGGGILQPLPDFLQTYLVGEDIEKDYEIEPKPFAR